MAIILDGSDAIGDLGDALDAKLTTPGAWTAYTPTWAGVSSTGGVSTGAYTQIGRTVHFWANYVLGTAVSITAGISAPLPTGKAAGSEVLVNGVFIDMGTGYYAPLVVGQTLYAARAGVSYVDAETPSNTIPFTWATGDKISVTGTYEAA